MLRKWLVLCGAILIGSLLFGRADAQFWQESTPGASPEASPLACATPVDQAEGTPILTVTAAQEAGSPGAIEPGTVVGLYPCGTPEGSPEGGPLTTPMEGMDANLQAIDIAFVPTELHIQANTDAQIIFTNTGVLPHNFTIDELGIKTSDLASGASETVTINAPAGTYQFYCAIPGHKDAGMIGKLIVE